MKLNRKQIREALNTVPIDQILSVPGELTHKQREFARLVASGETGAGAYRKAYSPTAKPKTAGNTASDLKKHPGISREIEAYKLANEAAKYRTPQQLRDLVIHSLVQVVIDPDAKHAQRVQAAKVLGTVTEVAAFTERREVTHIKTAEDARAALMAKLHEVMKAGAVDVEARAVDSLLAEIVGPEPGNDTEAGNVANDAAQPMQDDDAMSGAMHESGPDGDPVAVDFAGDESATPTAPNADWSPAHLIHTIPHTQSQQKSTPSPAISDAESLEAELETPPSGKTK